MQVQHSTNVSSIMNTHPKQSNWHMQIAKVKKRTLQKYEERILK